MALRGVLFDLDGTLADTAAAERSVWPSLAAVIESHVPGLDVDELRERYRSRFEAHWQDFLEGRIDFGEYRWNRLSDAIGPWGDLDEELFQAYRAEKRNALERLRPFDDAVETLRTLREAGLRVGLLTNGPSWLQRRKLEVTDLEGELDGIAISEELGVAKPETAAFEAAAQMIDCGLGDVAMVGDSPMYDVMGARDAGVALAVLVTGGLAIQADGAATVRTLSELPALLGLRRQT